MSIEQSQPIPVEKGWPLLGVLPNFFGKDPYEYLKNIMLKNGDLVQLNIGPQPVYLVSHPDYLQRILRDNYQNYRKPDLLYNAGKVVVGNGLITSSGDLWLRQRRMIQPHLHRKQLEILFADIQEAISEVLETWLPLAKSGDEVELSEKMGQISLNIVTHTMFGKGVLPAAEREKIGQRATRIFKYIGRTLYSNMLPSWAPLPGKGQFLNDLAETKTTINQIIDKCRDEKETSASLIQMLIHAVDEESHQQMTEQQLFDEVMTIFMAGIENTATTLTWLNVVTHTHPDVLEKLKTEIDQVLGKRVPTFEDIPRLTYTRQVFMEVSRMYTAAPFLPRALNKADWLGEHYLPAEAMVLVFYHGVHHNPRVWDNPEIFDPERFTLENVAKLHPFAHVPFSAGPRKCAGDEFALLESILAIAMMFQKYNINVLPNQTFTSQLGGSMHPRYGVKAVFSMRDSFSAAPS